MSRLDGVAVGDRLIRESRGPLAEVRVVRVTKQQVVVVSALHGGAETRYRRDTGRRIGAGSFDWDTLTDSEDARARHATQRRAQVRKVLADRLSEASRQYLVERSDENAAAVEAAYAAFLAADRD